MPVWADAPNSIRINRVRIIESGGANVNGSRKICVPITPERTIVNAQNGLQQVRYDVRGRKFCGDEALLYRVSARKRHFHMANQCIGKHGVVKAGHIDCDAAVI